MAEAVYILCAITSLLCAGLLMTRYRRTRSRLLLWCTACFLGLAINNLLLFTDLVVFPEIDLSLLRAISGFLAVVTLLVGLVWDGT